MNKSIKAGLEIRNKIFGSGFAELEANRKANKANAIINDLNRSLLDQNYVRKFTDEDVVWADQVVDELILINQRVEDKLKEFFPEEYPEETQIEEEVIQ